MGTTVTTTGPSGPDNIQTAVATLATGIHRLEKRFGRLKPYVRIAQGSRWWRLQLDLCALAYRCPRSLQQSP